MTVHRAPRLVGRTVTVAVLLASAVYLMVYLYRWEWNRAVISGVFFLGAEIVLVTSVLFARLGRLERRLEIVAPLAQSPAPPAPGTDVDVNRESPFAWLSPADGRLGVFVPLLMGAGVILSAVAFVVEKVSASVARVTSTRRRVDSLGPSLPSGDLLSGPPETALLTESKPRATPLATLVLVIAAALLVPAIGLFADATQSRPDPDPDRTTVELDVWVRDVRHSATDKAAALLITCQDGVRSDRVEVTAVGLGRARMVVSGVMGEHARRKFIGCLQDATLDGVRAAVVSTAIRPSES